MLLRATHAVARLCILWGDDGDGPSPGAINLAPTPPLFTRKVVELWL
jgi:hypothetical protein